MEFGVLGSLRVRSADVPVDIRRGLPRTILTYLLLHVGDTVRSDVLADVLWGDQQPVNPANALQTQISYLRRQLAAHSPVQPILTRPGGYAIDVGRDAVDAHRFDRTVHAIAAKVASGEHDPQASIDQLDEALSWWRGAALEDVAGEPFAIAEAARLEELRLTAVELRHDAALALGRHREVAGDLAALAQEHPLRERLHALLMLALYRSGRQADALRAFSEARERLVDELGIEPGPDLRVLERRILEQDPTLALAETRPGPGREPASPTTPTPQPAHSSGHLPAAVTPMVGREVEMDRVARLLERSRAVTLTGPAGAGKTRLAIETARAAAGVCDVWYVDLGDIDDPAQVAADVAAAIDVPTVPNDDPIRAIGAALAARTGLLVLDTCEHVVTAAAALAGRLLRDAPGMRVLATSRRPLNVSGEIAWPVPPLALAGPGATVDELRGFPAIQLFVQRAEAVLPDFELTADNADDVSAICMALDGLPLAIELAAARVDVLPPRFIRERLTRRFELLVGGGVDTSARQQTLRGAIDWSTSLLEDREREAFARLGVLVGTFDLDAASCVTGIATDDDVLAVITSLVRHSMVARAGNARFRLLDTLRAYALDLLDQLDADDTRTRHASCFVAHAEAAEIGIRGADQLDWLDRARADLPNHRAAFEWMVSVGDADGTARLTGALGWFWTLDGTLADAHTQLGTALEFPDLSARHKAKLSWSLALIVASLGDLRRAAELALVAIACGRNADDPVQVGYGLNALAVAQWGLGDLDAAEASRDEAIVLFDEHHDAWGAGVSRVLRGRTALDRGSEDIAEVVADGLAAACVTGDRHLIGMAHEQLARLALRGGDLDGAVSHSSAAIGQHDEIGYVEGALAAHHIRGIALGEQGDLEAAFTEHVAALRAARIIDHRAAMCEALEGLALAHHHAGQSAEGAQLVGIADRERQRLDLQRRPDDAVLLAAAFAGDTAVNGTTGDNFDRVVAGVVSGPAYPASA